MRKLVVIEAPIIHEIRACYCKCSKSDEADNLQQLLRNGWYPATTIDPETCATFQVLGFFRLLAVVGNVTAHDFVASLERLADPTKGHKVPVSQLLFSHSEHHLTHFTGPL